MSVTQEPSDVNQGQNITLTCQVNIPLTDVTIRWTMAGKKSKKRLRGHLHPHKGTSVVTVHDIRPEDYGIYSCVVSYSLGDRTVMDMKTALLNYGKLYLENKTIAFKCNTFMVMPVFISYALQKQYFYSHSHNLIKKSC